MSYHEISNNNAVCQCACHQNGGCHVSATKSNCASIDLLYAVRQTIETWQKGCEISINDLRNKISENEKIIDLLRQTICDALLKLQLNEYRLYNTIQSRLEKIESTLKDEDVKLHRCPVCEGWKKPPKESGLVWCAACEGKGIIWG